MVPARFPRSPFPPLARLRPRVPPWASSRSQAPRPRCRQIVQPSKPASPSRPALCTRPSHAALGAQEPHAVCRPSAPARPRTAPQLRGYDGSRSRRDGCACCRALQAAMGRFGPPVGPVRILSPASPSQFTPPPPARRALHVPLSSLAFGRTPSARLTLPPKFSGRATSPEWELVRNPPGGPRMETLKVERVTLRNSELIPGPTLALVSEREMPRYQPPPPPTSPSKRPSLSSARPRLQSPGPPWAAALESGRPLAIPAAGTPLQQSGREGHGLGCRGGFLVLVVCACATGELREARAKFPKLSVVHFSESAPRTRSNLTGGPPKVLCPGTSPRLRRRDPHSTLFVPPDEARSPMAVPPVPRVVRRLLYIPACFTSHTITST